MAAQNHGFTVARDRLVRAVTDLGFPAELGELCARQIGSPKGIDRLTHYVEHVRPRNTELLVDEMLAICDQIQTWRDKKSSEEAQARYSAWLNSDLRE